MLHISSKVKNGMPYLADELNLVSLNVLDTHDTKLGKEMQRQVVDGVSEDRFLDEEHVALCLLNLLDHVEQVCSLLFQDLVHLSVVVDNNLVLHVGFRRAELELDEGDSSLLNSGRTTTALYNLLVQDQTINHLTVIDDTTGLLEDTNVLQVDVVGSLGVDDSEDRVDGHGGELGFLCDNLGGERS